MKFRYARHTNRLDELSSFYCKTCGLSILGSFENHSDYDGIFLGIEGLNWHLEFTQSLDKAVHRNNEDDLLVLYPVSTKHYNEIIENIRSFGIKTVIPKNPYWIENGICIKDPDGYNVVISNQNV